MPARKPDAEAATENPFGDSPARGNVTPSQAEAILDDLGTTQELVMKQEELIQKLSKQVDTLQAKQAEAEEEALPPSLRHYEPPVLLEGRKRYAARYTELTLMRVGTGHEMHGGVAVPVPIVTGKQIDFNGGVYETGDPDEIEFIESHADFGLTFWEDPSAVRRTSHVEVQDGMKTANTTPRVPLSAPMAP